MGRIPLRLVFLLLFTAVVAAGAAGWGYSRYVGPGPPGIPITVVIPKGSGVAAIASLLQKNGIIEDARIFRFGVRLTGIDTALRAGEYQFPAYVSPHGAARILVHGETVVRRVTLAEGLTSAQILDHLKGEEGLTGLVVPEPAEGTLLPETYHYGFGDKRTDIVGRMKTAMERTLAELWAERAPGLPLKEPRDALILASLVEKETGIAEERPHIAGVFINRLRRNMHLQSDPTVAFGLAAGPLDRPLTRSDLKTPTPYNTYTNRGLPPGPICNPGRDSIAAVLQPLKTENLYFVADGSGAHVFAKTLARHNRNVAKWRRIERARR